jgi:hypothetical protein
MSAATAAISTSTTADAVTVWTMRVQSIPPQSTPGIAICGNDALTSLGCATIE